MKLSLLTNLLLLPLTVPHTAAATYYVAADGNDAQYGLTLHAPFRTIHKAAEVMQPGDTCMIRGGEYREKIVPPRGGTSEEARITYRAYRDEKPGIKGSDRVTGWADLGGGVWKAVLPAKFFASSPYNPFSVKVSGHCIGNVGGNHTLGMVYLNGEPFAERLTLVEVKQTPKAWCAAQESEMTVIHARFDTDPNQAVAELNVRDGCYRRVTGSPRPSLPISVLRWRRGQSLESDSICGNRQKPKAQPSF